MSTIQDTPPKIAPVTPMQQTPAILQSIRGLFTEHPRNEFDLCYYELRKVALCAHLLKPK